MKTFTKITGRLLGFMSTLTFILIGYILARIAFVISGYRGFSETEVYITASILSITVLVSYIFDLVKSNVQTVKSYSVNSFTNYIETTSWHDDFAYICINDFEPPYTIIDNTNVLNFLPNSKLYNYLNDVPYHIHSVKDDQTIEEYFPPSRELLKSIVDFIELNRTAKAIILHCGLGLSRSVAIEKYINQRFGLVDAKTFDKIQVSNNQHLNQHIYTTLMSIKGLQEF